MIRTLNHALAVYFLSLILTFAFYPSYIRGLHQLYPYLDLSMIAVWATLSLPMQLPVFISGFLAYFLIKEQNTFKFKSKFLYQLLLLISVGFTIFLALYFPERAAFFSTVFFSFPLMLIVVFFGIGGGGILINKLITSMGRVSFSAYIWHFAVLNFIYISRDNGSDLFGLNLEPSNLRFTICLSIVLILTYLISYISYRFIERPFIGLGNKVASSLGNNNQ